MALIEERDGSNNFVAFYTRTGNIGGILSRTTSTDTLSYHYDGNGNVVSLSDDSENVVAEYAYDAYGNVISMSGAQAADNPLRFSTKYFDGNTGYYDYGFRSYDPVTGRWLNRDPIGESGGLNLYGFVGNSPGNGRDEYGLKDWSKVSPFLSGNVQNNSSCRVQILFDTDPDKARHIPRKVYIVNLPPGWESVPAKADIDYVRKYGDKAIRWYHLNLGGATYTTDTGGNTRLATGIARPVYTNQRSGLYGNADASYNQHFTTGEWINKTNGLPHTMVNGSQLINLSLLGAATQGFIRRISK